MKRPVQIVVMTLVSLCLAAFLTFASQGHISFLEALLIAILFDLSQIILILSRHD